MQVKKKKQMDFLPSGRVSCPLVRCPAGWTLRGSSHHLAHLTLSCVPPNNTLLPETHNGTYIITFGFWICSNISSFYQVLFFYWVVSKSRAFATFWMIFLWRNNWWCLFYIMLVTYTKHSKPDIHEKVVVVSLVEVLTAAHKNCGTRRRYTVNADKWNTCGWLYTRVPQQARVATLSSH